jgi:Bacterial Ig-like domain (group 3)/FG-GAP-like repeat
MAPIPQLPLRLLLLIVVFAIGVVTVTAQAFTLPTDYPVGENPNTGAAADFNADGKQDLAIGNVLNRNVSILLNKGDGTFNTAVNYPADFNPEAVATGDFNADGKVDLAVGNFLGGPFSTGNISILLGNGNGTFQAAVNYDAGSPYSISVVDLNADGKQDLAVASWTTNKATVLLGNGNGTFQSAVTYAVGSEPRDVVVADYNGDTKLDLAVSNAASSNISILPGNGDGTFQGAVNIDMGTRTFGMVTTDLNGDNKPDLIAACADADSIMVLLGNGDGSFQTAVPYAVGDDPLRLALADFNGDGKTDVVVVNNQNIATYSLLRSNGNGTLQPAVTSPARSNSFSAIAADFDGDGKPDLAILNNVFDLVDVFLNSPKLTGLTFTARETVSATFQVASFISYDNTKTAASFTATINWGDGTAPSAAMISANGTGSFKVTGTHTYAANGNYNTTIQLADDSGNFASATGTASVLRAATTTTLSSSANPSDFGQPVTFTATVTSTSGTPSGMVQFKDNGNNLGTPVTLNGSGVATVTTSTLDPRTHTITAVYSGDAAFEPSTATLAGGQTVRSTPRLNVNNVSIMEGDSGTRIMSFTVTLSAASNLTVTADYATTGLSLGDPFFEATAGVDYRAASGTLVFNPGDTTKHIEVTIFGDITNEFEETFFFKLSNPTNAEIQFGKAIATILNDDDPVILTDAITGRAIALDSVTQTAEPFTLSNPNNLSTNHTRRISIFVWRLPLLPGDKLSDVGVFDESTIALASEGFDVEFVGATPIEGVTQINFIWRTIFAPARELKLRVGVNGRGPASKQANIKMIP